MESYRRGFGACVVDQLWGDDVAGHGGDGDDHAVVLGDHVREEFFDEAEVGEDVDVEGFLDGGFGGVEDCHGGGDAGVVDEDGGVGEGGADGVGYVGDGAGGGDVAVVEVDVGVG